MTFKPAHKDTTAGQIRNEITLADYIANKMEVLPLKKLTFNEWWQDIGVWSYGNYMETQQAEGIWQAAQENK